MKNETSKKSDLCCYFIYLVFITAYVAVLSVFLINYYYPKTAIYRIEHFTKVQFPHFIINKSFFNWKSVSIIV